ncbi:MAG: tyrosine-type recombinase/integrase, partial [Actinobacteria bacterium]|nr:tyrosine-type recombinase/integrase [Actinomycetota bacterium]
PKTRNSVRTVPLPRRVVRELEAHLEAYTAPTPDALVFTDLGGSPLRRSGFARSWWHPAVRATGLDPLRFHELRHTFVALWVAAGAITRKCP